MPYCLIRIRDASMISSVMQHLMAQAAEPVALILRHGYGDIFGDIFGDFFGGGRSSGRRNGPAQGAKCPSQCKNFFEEAYAFTAQRSLNSTIRRHALPVAATELSRAHLLRHVPSVMVQVRLSDRVSLYLVVQNVTTCPSCGGSGKVVKDKCPTCHGTGYNTKKVRKTVEIPAGIDNGQCVRIREYGEPGINGGPRGDLLVEAIVSGSRDFERQDVNIFQRHPSRMLLQP